MTRTDSVVRARHRSLPRRYPPGLRLNSPDRVFVFVDYWRDMSGLPHPHEGVGASSSMTDSASRGKEVQKVRLQAAPARESVSRLSFASTDSITIASTIPPPVMSTPPMTAKNYPSTSA